MDENTDDLIASRTLSQNPVDIGARSVSMDGESPVKAPPNPYAESAARVLQQNQNALDLKMAAVAGTDPDAAAKAQQIGQQIGVPAGVVSSDMESAQRGLSIQRNKRLDLLKSDPVLGDMFANKPGFAEVSHDDLENLHDTGKAFRWGDLWDGIGSIVNPFPTGAVDDPSWKGNITRGLVAGAAGNEAANIGWQLMEQGATADQINSHARLKEIETSSVHGEGLLGSTAEVVGGLGSMLPAVGKYGVAGATIGGTAGLLGGPFAEITVPGGIIGGFAQGAGAGFNIEMGRQAAGQAYLRMVREGADPAMARRAALAVGALDAAMFTAGSRVFTAPYKAARAMLGKEAVAAGSQALVKRTAGRAAATAAIHAAEGYGTGIGLMSGQSALEFAGRKYVGSDLGWKDFIAQQEETIKGAALSLPLISAAGPAVEFLAAMRGVNQAKRGLAVLQAVSNNAKESKVAERAPQQYEDFIAAQTKGTASETVYIDGQELLNAFAQAKIDPKKLAEAGLPTLFSEAQMAAATGGDVKIPMSDYAAKIARTDLNDAMLPHMRLSEDAPSAAEAARVEAMMPSMRIEAEEALKEAAKRDDGFAKSARAVEKKIEDQLVATGRVPKEEAKVNAKIVRDFYVVNAARLGITPEALYEQYPYKIEKGASAGEALSQAAKDQTNTPEFKKWIAGSKIQQVVYHGTNKTFTRINMKRGAQGVFWVTSDRGSIERGEAGAQGSGKIMELYASIKNPAGWEQYEKKSIAELKRDGYDGVILKDPDGSFNAIVFDPKQIKSAIGNSGAFDKNDANILRQPDRAYFDPKRLATILTEGSDVSSMLHETGHAFLHISADLASRENATPAMKADMQTILDWFGVKDLETWNKMTLEEQRPYHEQWALNFEKYLHDGKAPSVQLQGVFDKFKSWLTRLWVTTKTELNDIYKEKFGKDLPIMTGEVRQVMDRMLASEDAIKDAEQVNSFKAVYESQEASGMDDLHWAAYQAMERERHDAATADLTKASLRNMQWLSNARGKLLKEMQARNDARRAEVRAEVADQVYAEPVRRAEDFIRRGQVVNADGERVKADGVHKLSRDGVNEVAPELADKLPKGTVIEKGLHPDEVAPQFGFKDGRELVQALADAKPLNEDIDARTDERMQAENADTKADMEKEIDRALHNEMRTRMVAVELRHLAKAMQPVKAMIEAARQVAREMLSRMKISDIHASDYRAAEARAAREGRNAVNNRQSPETAGKSAYTRHYNEAIKNGVDQETAIAQATVKATEATRRAQERLDAHKAKYGENTTPTEVAVKAKRNELFQNQLATEAGKIEDEVSAGVKYLRNVLSDRNRKAMGADNADQIEGILERFQLATRRATKEGEKIPTLAEFLANELERSGYEPPVADQIAVDQYRKPYHEMTVDEFRDLVRSVKAIEFMGKHANKIIEGVKKADFAELREWAVNHIAAEAARRGIAPKQPRTPRSLVGAVEKQSELIAGSMIPLSIDADILDGAQPGGPVVETLMIPANKRAQFQHDANKHTSQVLSDLLTPVLGDGFLTRIFGGGEYFPSIGRKLNTVERLVVALNSLNESNLKRLRDGEGWTNEQILPILQSLTNKEWDAVEGISAHFEHYKPMVAELYRRLYGTEPDWIEPRPFVIKTADGDLRQIKGGYYPVKFDPEASARSEQHAAATDAKAKLREAYGASMTRNSFTKGRVNEVLGRPLTLSLNGMFSAFDEVINDLAWREWMIDSNRFMNDPAINKAIREYRGSSMEQRMKDNIAMQARRPQHIAIERFASKVAYAASAARLAWNLASLPKHFFDIMRTVAALDSGNKGIALKDGMRWMLSAGADWLKDPFEFYRNAMQKSGELARRFENRNALIASEMGGVRVRGGMLDFVKTYAFLIHHQVWKTTDAFAWTAAFNKFKALGFEDAKASDMADHVLIVSQRGGQRHNLSQIEKIGGLMPLYTRAMHFMSGLPQLAYREAKTREPGVGGAANSLARNLFIASGSVMLEMTAMHLLRPRKKDEKPPTLSDLAKEFGSEQASYLMSGIPLVREGSTFVQSWIDGKQRQYEGPMGTSIVPDIGHLGIDLANSARGRKIDGDRLRREIVGVVGDTASIPAAAINKFVDGVQSLYRGDTKNPLAPLMGAPKK